MLFSRVHRATQSSHTYQNTSTMDVKYCYTSKMDMKSAASGSNENKTKKKRKIAKSNTIPKTEHHIMKQFIPDAVVLTPSCCHSPSVERKIPPLTISHFTRASFEGTDIPCGKKNCIAFRFLSSRVFSCALPFLVFFLYFWFTPFGRDLPAQSWLHAVCVCIATWWQ